MREARGTRGARGAREARGARGTRGAWGAWPDRQKLLAARGGAWARVWRARNFWRRVGVLAGPDLADFGLNG